MIIEMHAEIYNKEWSELRPGMWYKRQKLC